MRSRRAFSRSCSMDTGAVLCVAALIAGPFRNGRSVGRAWRSLIVLNRACRCHAGPDLRGPRLPHPTPSFLVFGIQEACHHLWIGGGQLANIVFADIRSRSFFDAMGSRHKRQPMCQLLLPGTAIGEKKNFVWEEPSIDLLQQFTGVLGHGIAGDEDLFRLREAKI